MIRRLAADRLTIDETEFLVYTTDWVDTPQKLSTAVHSLS